MPNNLHVSKPLTNVALAYIQDADEFVADKVLPPKPVKKETDLIPEWSRENIARLGTKNRAKGTEAATTDLEFLFTKTYIIENYALAVPCTIEDTVNLDAPFDLKREATTFLGEQALIRKEKSFTDNFMATSKWSKDVAGVASSPNGITHATPQVLHWSNASSTPIADMRYGIRFIHSKTGRRANTIVLSADVAYMLADSPDIIGRLDRGQTPGGPAGGSPENIADVLGRLLGCRVFIQGSIIDSSNEGVTMSHDFMASKKCLVMFVPRMPSLFTPSAAMAFGQDNIGGTPTYIRDYYVDSKQARLVELQMYFDHVLTGSDLGFFFNDIIA